MTERILFIYDYTLHFTGNEGRFIRHPYGTAHQDAECGHIGGRAYGRAMWTHRWQSVSYYLRQRSTTSWEWGAIHQTPLRYGTPGRRMWTHRWQSVRASNVDTYVAERPLLSTTTVYNLLGMGGDSDTPSARHTRTPNVDTYVAERTSEQCGNIGGRASHITY